MKEEIAQIQSDALAAIGAASGEQELDEARIAFLGKKGRLTATSAGMKNLSKEEKPVVGQLLNATRGAITEALEGKRNALQDEADRAALEGLDLTLPGRPATSIPSPSSGTAPSASCAASASHWQRAPRSKPSSTVLTP